jgi:hypothetical protein
MSEGDLQSEEAVFQFRFFPVLIVDCGVLDFFFIVTTETTQKLENKAENKNCRTRVNSSIFEAPARL